MKARQLHMKHWLEFFGILAAIIYNDFFVQVSVFKHNYCSNFLEIFVDLHKSINYVK